MSIWNTFVSNIALATLMKVHKQLKYPPWTAIDEASYKVILGRIDIGLDNLQEDYPWNPPDGGAEYREKLNTMCISIMAYDKEIREEGPLTDEEQARYVLLERNIENITCRIAKIDGIKDIKDDILEQASLKIQKGYKPEDWRIEDEVKLATLSGQIELYVSSNETSYPYNPPDDSAQKEALLQMCTSKLSFEDVLTPEYLILVRNIKNLAKSLELIKPIPAWNFTTLKLVCINIDLARHKVVPPDAKRPPSAEYSLQYNEAYARKVVSFIVQNEPKSCWSKIKKFLNRYL